MLTGFVLAVILLGPAAGQPDEDDSQTDAEPAGDQSAEAADAGEPAKIDSRSHQKRKRVLRLPAAGPVQPWVRTQTFSEHFRENYDPTDRNDGFVSLVNRLNVGWDARLKRGVSLHNAFRVDTQNLFLLPASACDANEDGTIDESERDTCRFADDARLERTTFRVDSRYVSGTVGDYQAQFGRGIPLAVRKVDAIGVDATIKGGRLDVHGGPIELTGLAGFANAQNSDFATRQLVEDPGYPAQYITLGNECDVRDRPRIGNPLWTTCSDMIAAGRATATLPGKVSLGAHYGNVMFGQQISQGINESIHLAGGDIGRKRIAKHWDVFAGGTALVRLRDAPDLEVPSLEGTDYVGYATYLANTLIFGSTTALFELKHYRDYMVALLPTQLQYASPPSLEREDQQVAGAFNATGGRLRLDHTWRDRGFTLYGNFMGYAFSEAIQEEPLSNENGRVATHSYMGVIWRLPKITMLASTGYRYEWHLDDGRFRRKFPHIEFYTSVPIAKGRRLTHSLNGQFAGRFEDKQVSNVDVDEKFAKGFVQLGYSMAPYLQVSFIGGYSTEFPAAPGLVDLTGEACDAELGLCKPHLWPGAEVRVNFYGNNFVRVFVGRQVGGRVCVNGSCRTLPDFEGVRGELVLSF
jgi:hypothetical protein